MANLRVERLSSDTRRGLVIAARVGHAAKGLVYSVLGGLALLAAFGERDGKLTGGKGAINELAEQPLGGALLWITAAGLACYALWASLRAARDPEHAGGERHALLRRAGYGLAGLSHGALAVYAAKLAHGSSARSSEDTPSLVAHVLELPFGRLLVAIAGLVAIIFGIYQIVRAIENRLEAHFSSYRMSASQLRVAQTVARFGTFARGVVFPIIGGSLLMAAMRRDPSEAEGIGGALRDLSAQPFGGILLAIVAAGLLAYGIHQFFVARFGDLPAAR